MILTTKELWDRRLARAKVNHATYKKLYVMCTNVINGIQHIRPPVTACSWTVPENVMFRPPYKRTRARRYVTDKLEWGGFHVDVRDEFTLDIDWTRNPTRNPTRDPGKTSRDRRAKSETPVVATVPSIPKKKTLAEMAAHAERLTGRMQRR